MSTTVVESVEETEQSINNNWPYTASTGLDPTVGVDDGILNMQTRVNMVNFETVAQNLASLPSRDTYPEKGKIVRTFYVTPDNTITMTIDRTIENKVIKTISGYGISGVLTKTTAWIKDTVVDRVYS